jgi:hypothetical protein
MCVGNWWSRRSLMNRATHEERQRRKQTALKTSSPTLASASIAD